METAVSQAVSASIVTVRKDDQKTVDTIAAWRNAGWGIAGALAISLIIEVFRK